MQLIKNVIIVLSFLCIEAIIAKDIYITVDRDAVQSNQKSIASFEVIEVYNDIAVVKVDEQQTENISHLMHEEFHRCGGFVKHASLAEAKLESVASDKRSFAKNFIFNDYSLTEKTLVSSILKETLAEEIQETIEHLSSYKNRHYKSETGVASQEWVKERWSDLAQGRSDATVELYEHSGWPQPSVVMKIEGRSEQAIVVGGHGDSIASSFFGGRGKNATAPGADDNASGIATITEIIRVLMNSSYKPEKTIYFMSYAAEEVGLLGSREIAKDFKSQNIDVVGVLQLDMTNYKGSEDLDIVMMTDYTNEEQNKFIGTLIETYLPTLNWGFDRCGYGCSDHASWHGEGFPASVPFEASKRDMNRHIHTKRDTIERSDGHARHAEKFAKLALAYVIELDR